MDNRKHFIEYVRNRSKPINSPQMGVGFDTRIVDKEWISETTLEDTVSVVEQFDILPLIPVDICDLREYNPELVWSEISCKDNGDYIIPYSQQVTDIVHSLGLLAYSHILPDRAVLDYGPIWQDGNRSLRELEPAASRQCGLAFRCDE